MLLDAKTLQRKNGLNSPEFTGELAFLQGGKQLAMGCHDGTLRIMEMHGKGMKFVTHWKGHDAPVTRIAIDAQERVAVSGDAKGVVIVWALQQAAAVAGAME